MKKFHIVFKENEDNVHSKGETFVDHTPILALDKFNDKYPDAIFAVMYNVEETSPLIKHQMEQERSNAIDAIEQIDSTKY